MQGRNGNERFRESPCRIGRRAYGTGQAVLLAFLCMAILNGCAGIRAWQATAYARSQRSQITLAMRTFLKKSPVIYYFGAGPILPVQMPRNASLIRSGIVTIVRVPRRDIDRTNGDAFAIHLTPKGRAFARKDHWNFKGAGPRGQFFTISVGELHFEKLLSVGPFLSFVPWWWNSTDRTLCFEVRYSALFVLTQAGSTFRHVVGGNSGPILGGNQWWFLLRPMYETVVAQPHISDAGKSVIKSAELCNGQKHGWHVVFPFEGTM